jgi:hypothetical protein
MLARCERTTDKRTPARKRSIEQRQELPEGRNGEGAGSELARDQHDPSPARDAASRQCSTVDILIEEVWRRGTM